MAGQKVAKVRLARSTEGRQPSNSKLSLLWCRHVKLTPKGVVFSFLFLFFSGADTSARQAARVTADTCPEGMASQWIGKIRHAGNTEGRQMQKLALMALSGS